MMFAVVWYTILCVALNKVVSGGGSNLMTDEDIRNLTPEIYKERVEGSKWVFVSEHSFVGAIWSLKTCMLVIYARITEGLHQRRWINWLAIYVGLGFIATELTLFLICRPLSNYWAVPTPNYQCSSYQHYEIIQGCIHISADVFMLIIAIPLLMKVRVPVRQKLILLFIFGMGAFVIVAAILTKVYCLVPSLISYIYMNWYFREATVAVLVTNIPLVWSLLRDVFPSLKSWTGGSRGRTEQRYRSGRWTFSKGSAFRSTYGPPSRGGVSMHSMHDYRRSVPFTPPQKVISEISESPEPSEGREYSEDGSTRGLRIRQDVTVTVERGSHPPALDQWEANRTRAESQV